MPDSLVSLSIYIYLLPGIAGYFVYESLAETMPRQTFDRIAMALAFTVVSTLASGYLVGVPFFPTFMHTDSIPDQINAFASRYLWQTFLVAMILAVIFAWFRNRGWVFYLMRRLGITRRTGTIDPWHQVFSKYRKRWILIKFRDGTQLAGWPKYYSEDGSRKEMFVANVTWYRPKSKARQSQDIEIFASGVVVGKVRNDDAFEAVDSDEEGVLITNFDHVLWIEIARTRAQ